MTKRYIGVKMIDAWAEQRDGKDGYAVKYADGYISWSPADVFNNAYREVDDGCMSFGLAIEAAKEGVKIARRGWNGKNMWLELQVPDAHSKMQQPYLYMSPVDGKLVPWLASQTDVLADDWYIVD